MSSSEDDTPLVIGARTNGAGAGGMFNQPVGTLCTSEFGAWGL